MLLTKSQLAYFGSTLNEALNGFAISDYYIALGTPREMVEALRNKLDLYYLWHADDAMEEVPVSDAEHLILRNASLLCIERLTRDEFVTRLGESQQAAQKLLRRMESRDHAAALPR